MLIILIDLFKNTSSKGAKTQKNINVSPSSVIPAKAGIYGSPLARG
jgi:hypothetical protein